MSKKSKYEKQMEKLKEARKEIWKRTAIYMVAIYLVAVVISRLANLPIFYTARTLLIGLFLIFGGLVSGAYIQAEVDKHVLPPPEERESVEMKQRIKEDE